MSVDSRVVLVASGSDAAALRRVIEQLDGDVVLETTSAEDAARAVLEEGVTRIVADLGSCCQATLALLQRVRARRHVRAVVVGPVDAVGSGHARQATVLGARTVICALGPEITREDRVIWPELEAQLRPLLRVRALRAA